MGTDQVAVQAGVGPDPSCVAVLGTQRLQPMEPETKVSVRQTAVILTVRSNQLLAALAYNCMQAGALRPFGTSSSAA